MSATQQILTVTAAAVPLLAAIGGVIRYLLQILTAVQQAIGLAKDAAESIERHIEQSGSVHAAITDRLAAHDTQLAVIHQKVGP